MGALSGMKEICAHVKRSEVTVLDMIRNEGLPAVKIFGVWESDTEKIESWRLNKIDLASNGNAKMGVGIKNGGKKKK